MFDYQSFAIFWGCGRFRRELGGHGRIGKSVFQKYLIFRVANLEFHVGLG
jgi:hypothetical protein